MPLLDMRKNYNLRSNLEYTEFDYYNLKFARSFFPQFTKFWNNLPEKIKSNNNIIEFKEELKLDIKPNKIKHFSKGNKVANSLLTRIRLGRSRLNDHLFSIGQIDSPSCLCHETETVDHYLHDCFLFTVERQNLFSLVEHYIPAFKTMNKKAKIQTMLNGYKTHDKSFEYTNFRVTLAVQNYILQTKRFADKG